MSNEEVGGAALSVRTALRGMLPEDYLALVLLVVLGCVVFAQFTLRYVFGLALTWGEEVARMLLICVVFAGTAGAAARRVHIAVGEGGALFGPRFGPVIARLALVLSAIVFAVGAWLALEIAQRIWGGRMATLPISRGWTYLIVAACLALSTWRTVVLIWRGAR